MKYKRGFTLMELLAVTVILTIIAFIAIPIVLRLIEDAKRNAAKDSAHGIIHAGELEYVNNAKRNDKGSASVVVYTHESNLKYKGPKNRKFRLVFNTDRKSKFTGMIDGYCIIKRYDEQEVSIITDIKKEEECMNYLSDA